MFTLFRYGLLPVVLFCGVVIAASIDAFSTNAVRASTWPQTVATVMESRDFGDTFAEFSGKQNTFPDPHGKLRYAISGRTYVWQGRGRDIGVTVMKPGDKIQLHYNPENPRDISTLVLLGAATGSVILAVAVMFLAFYVWFFWLRGFLHRAGPDDFDGDVVGSFADRVLEPSAAQTERSRFALEDRGTTFGKRDVAGSTRRQDT